MQADRWHSANRLYREHTGEELMIYEEPYIKLRAEKSGKASHFNNPDAIR